MRLLPGNCFNFSVLTPASEVLESIRSLTFTVLDAMNASGGSTTKLLISPRNTRKVSVFSRTPLFTYLAQSRLLGNMSLDSRDIKIMVAHYYILPPLCFRWCEKADTSDKGH